MSAQYKKEWPAVGVTSARPGRIQLPESPAPKKDDLGKFQSENLLTWAKFGEQVERARKWCEDNDKVYLFSAVYGSQNYGLATFDSDVDVKAFFVPKPRELLLSTKLETYNIKEEGSEENQLLLKDVRSFFKELRKGNLHFFELLYTNYTDVADVFKDTFKSLVAQREEIARFVPGKFVCATYGLMYHLKRELEGMRLDDAKLHKKVAFYCYLSGLVHSYMNGKSFSECLAQEDSNRFYRYLKLGKFDRSTTYGYFKDEYNAFEVYATQYINGNVDPDEVDEDVATFLDDTLYTFLRYRLLGGAAHEF